MNEFVLIKIEDTGIIPIINMENPKYAMVTPRIYKQLIKAGVTITKIEQDELNETTKIPEFVTEQHEVRQNMPANNRPTSRRRPAIVLMDVVVKKGETIIEVAEEVIDVEVDEIGENVVEEFDIDKEAKDLISSIKFSQDVDNLNKVECKVVLDYLGERCVYRDNLDTRRENVRLALFKK